MPKFKATLELIVEANDEDAAYHRLAEILWEGEGRDANEWEIEEVEKEKNVY